jgi:hypothetical protein
MLSEYQWCYVASVHFLAGRYEEALAAARRSGDRIVDDQGWIAASLVRLGRLEAARDAASRLVEAVRPIWAGESSPTDEAVLSWFTSAYPIRNEADRRLLAASINIAMQGR